MGASAPGLETLVTGFGSVVTGDWDRRDGGLGQTRQSIGTVTTGDRDRREAIRTVASSDLLGHRTDAYQHSTSPRAVLYQGHCPSVLIPAVYIRA